MLRGKSHLQCIGLLSILTDMEMSIKLSKTPITYYGGKQRMLQHILPRIPQHEIYTEAFVGGGAVFWAKKPVTLEVINDLNGELINFYWVVKTRYEDFKKMALATLHSRKLHKQAFTIYSNPEGYDVVTRAWAVWVLSSQGFAGKLGSSWGYDKSKNTMAKKIQNMKARFNETDMSSRLELAQIECNDALKVIASRDSTATFHYVDPPYYNSNCGHYSGYSLSDFENLLKLLSKVGGKFLLSCYPSELISQYIEENGWSTISFKQPVAVSKTAVKDKTEVLVANYQL